MRINIIRICYLAICLALSISWTANAQTLPTKDQVYAKMKLINDYWINTHSDPGNNQWQRAAYMVGNMSMYSLQKEQKYYDYALDWSIQNNWALNGGATTRHADNQGAGSTYIDLYKIAPADYKIQDITTSISGMVNSTKVDDWWWIDAQFMAMPQFTKLGLHYNDTRYFDKMYALYYDCKTRRGLYDTTANLWYRDGAFVYPQFTTPNGKKSFWSRGNGWVFAAHARVLDILPTSDPHYQEYLTTFKNMAAALKSVQRTDGFWNVSLYDPQDYPGPETSGTGFFTFGLAWGINKGHLDRATYEPVVAKAWNGIMTTAVKSDGFVGYIQGVGKEPASSQPVTSTSNFDFGVGAVLLAGSEVYKLAASTVVPPIAPTNLAASTVSSSQINLTWADNSNNEAGFYIERKTGTSSYVQVASVAANITSYSNTGLAANTTYTYRVRAFNDTGNSSYSNEASATTFGVSLPVESKLIVTNVTASSYTGANIPYNSIDGNLATRWTASGSSQWVLYDLGTTKTVTRVRVAWYNPNFRYQFKIQLSTDGTNFTTVYTDSANRNSSFKNYDFADRQARYVRLIGLSSYIGVSEAEIYGMN
jgi:unsaturated rhamnogalacturonyl hydrolase